MGFALSGSGLLVMYFLMSRIPQRVDVGRSV